MSSSSRLYIASIGGVIALGVLAFVGPLAVRVDQPVRQTEASQSAKQIEPPIASPCALYEDVKESAACQRDEADLQAQQKMADAAWAAVGVSVLALFGLGATVWFARQAWLAARSSARADNKALRLARIQLKEARKVSADTAKITQAQSRAYVHVSEAWVDFTEEVTGIAAAVLTEPGDEEGPKFVPKLMLKFENVGQTATVFLDYVVDVDQEHSTATLSVRIPDGLVKKLSNLAPNSERVVEVTIHDLRARILQYRANPRRSPPTQGLLGEYLITSLFAGSFATSTFLERRSFPNSAFGVPIRGTESLPT